MTGACPITGWGFEWSDTLEGSPMSLKSREMDRIMETAMTSLRAELLEQAVTDPDSLGGDALLDPVDYEFRKLEREVRRREMAPRREEWRRRNRENGLPPDAGMPSELL